MNVRKVYRELKRQYGPQGWWPRHRGRKRPGFDPRFEIMVGAILTQNTAWTNVKKAIATLYEAKCLDANTMCRVRADRLKHLIRPAGYYNQKAKKLKILAHAYQKSDIFSRSQKKVTLDEKRRALLSLWGIGRETADSILLYACEQPIFVVDAYTRRLLASRGHRRRAKADYDEIRTFFESRLPKDANLFNEYHALIVRWGKEYGKSARTSE